MADKIKHYEILEQKVTEDAIVYKAWDPVFSRHVAIKEPLPGLLHNTTFLNAFMEEGSRLAQINDPYVGKLYDLIPQGEIDEKCYLVLECLGESLENLLKAGPVDVPKGRTILIDALRGLSAIHKTGLIHANLCPSNILVTPEGRAKITDLRLARAVDREGTIPIGSAKYMAPEILSGRGSIGPWSDLYSLGCIAYETFLGSDEFKALVLAPSGKHLDEREIMDPRYREWHCDLSLKAKPLMKLNDKIPEVVSSSVAGLMEKSIEQRYRSADQALRDLASGAVKREVETAVPRAQTRHVQETQVYGGDAGRTRVTVGAESRTPPARTEGSAPRSFLQDFLIILAVTMLGLFIVAVIIKLS